jgi:hypothetical protein
MAYTTQALVLADLGVTSSTITASSVPSTSDISNWISEAKAEIDSFTGRAWESTSVSNEYYDYDGTGILMLKNTPVISISSLQTEIMGVGATTSSWDTLTEGRTGADNFELYSDIGVVKFHSSTNGKWARTGSKSIRVSYSYGQSSVPLLIQRLATLIVSERYIMSFANASAGQLGGSISVGTIKVSDPTNFSINRLMSIRNEKDRLYTLVGTTKVFSAYYSW